jgi:nucleolar protein 16
MVKKNNKPRKFASKSAKRRRKILQRTNGLAVPRVFANEGVQKAWSHRKTLKQNYAALGLLADPNRSSQLANVDELSQRPIDADLTDLQSQRFDQTLQVNGSQCKPKRRSALSERAQNLHATLENAQAAAANAPQYQVRTMSINEQYRIRQLVQLHKDDYEAMARDIKINVMQETAGQLEKRVKLWQHLQTL